MEHVNGRLDPQLDDSAIAPRVNVPDAELEPFTKAVHGAFDAFGGVTVKKLLRYLEEAYDVEVAGLQADNLILRTQLGEDQDVVQLPTHKAQVPAGEAAATRESPPQSQSNLPSAPLVSPAALAPAGFALGGSASPTKPTLVIAVSEHGSSALVEERCNVGQDKVGLAVGTLEVSRCASVLSDCSQAMGASLPEAWGGSSDLMIQQEVDLFRKCSIMMQLGSHDISTIFHVWANFTKRMHRHVVFEVLKQWQPEAFVGASLSAPHPTYDVCRGITETVNAPRPDRKASVDEGSGLAGRYRRLVMSPNHKFRMGWDLAGAVLLGFDIIMIPLSAYRRTIARDSFTVFMDWLTLLFWTCDVCATLFTGYYDRGIIVMAPSRILRRYFCTWFLCDLIVIGPDWVFTLVEISNGGTSLASESGNSGKLLRALRFLRMSRLLRLLKLNRLMAIIRDRIDSEFLFIVLNIFKLILMLLVVNHFLAAIWYTIGEIGRTFNSENWIEHYNLLYETLGLRYGVSLHWTLTQFTPASMSVQPINTGERYFAITVLVFGLVLFSSFISSITNSMTQLRSMDDDRSKQSWLLRRYLRQHGIEPQLGIRILRYVEFAAQMNSTMVPESKVWVLGLLSDQLRNELKFSVSFSSMREHPLFDYLAHASKMTLVRLAASALSVESLASTDVLVTAGVIHTRMYIMESGEVQYTHVDEISLNGSSVTLQKKDWICEQSVWTQWVTLGEIRALSECTVVAIDAASFAKTFEYDLMAWKIAAVYAKNYVDWLCATSRGELNDIAVHDYMCNLVLGFIEDEEGNSLASKEKHSPFRGTRRVHNSMARSTRAKSKVVPENGTTRFGIPFTSIFG